MVHKTLLLILGLFAMSVYADTGYPSTIRITETDNSPACTVGQVKVTAGALTCNGQSATITTGSGYAVEPATVTFKLDKGFTASTGTFTSSVTVTGALGLGVTYGIVAATVTVSSNTILPGTTFYQNGQVNLSQVGVDVKIGGGLSFSSSPIKTGAYTATCNDTVILASSTLTVFSTITLPAASDCPGKVLAIWRVDQDTGTVLIVKNPGTDTVIGTGTIKLSAYDQGGTLQSDGVTGWHPYGRFSSFAPYAGGPQIVGGVAAAIATSSSVVTTMFYNESPQWICALRRNYGATGSANENLVVYGYDNNIEISTGPIAIPGTGLRTTNLSVPVYLPVGWHYSGWQPSNTTATIVRQSVGGMVGSYITATDGGLVLPTHSTAATTTTSPLIALLTCGGLTQ